MGFDQYHEPPEELPEETRTYVRVIQSMIEEAEAIDWYAQRLALEKDEEARAVMATHKRRSLSISEWIWSSYCGIRQSGGIF